MRFGINTFLFTSPFTNASTTLFPDFRRWGFESVEIALEHESHVDPRFVRSELERNGLVCGSLCGAYGPRRDLRGTRSEQAAGLDYVHHIIDAAGELGARPLVAPLSPGAPRPLRVA